MALANLILPQTRIIRGYTLWVGPGTKGVDYYSCQRLLGQNIGGISFEEVEPYFPLWQTVDAMVGVLGDLLDVSFQKLDTSAAALHEGITAYDVSEHLEDGCGLSTLSRTAISGAGTAIPSSEWNTAKAVVRKDTSTPGGQDPAVGMFPSLSMVSTF